MKNNELVKIHTPKSVLNWNPDPNQHADPGSTIRPGSPVGTGSPVRPGSLAGKSPPIVREFPAPTEPPSKKKKQLSHEEVLREYSGPGRSAECVKKSIEFFSTCENLVWKSR